MRSRSCPSGDGEEEKQLENLVVLEPIEAFLSETAPQSGAMSVMKPLLVPSRNPRSALVAHIRQHVLGQSMLSSTCDAYFSPRYVMASWASASDSSGRNASATEAGPSPKELSR